VKRAALVGLALLGCSSAGPRVAAAPAARRVSLEREGHLAVARGTVNGHPIRWLLDTGSDVHLVAGWFARRHALPLGNAATFATDHVGKPVPTSRADVVLALDGWGPLVATNVFVSDMPDVFETLGIGGIVSPQALDEEVWLDFAGGEMRTAGGGAAGAPIGPVRACAETDGWRKRSLYVAAVTIDGTAADLLVDTGAERTDVFLGSAPGKRLVARSVERSHAKHTMSGGVRARTVLGADLATGGVASAVDVDLVDGAPDATCPRDGALGMDVLERCAIRVGKTDLAARCRVR